MRGNSSLDSGGGKRDGRRQAHVATEHLKCSGVKAVVQKKKECEISHCLSRLLVEIIIFWIFHVNKYN